jgi:Na+/phosphate symporter
MQMALSTLLPKLLILVKLSNMDYEQYVADIQSIAINSEAHQDFLQLVGSCRNYYTVTELIERMVSHALNQWIEHGTDYLAVLWMIKTLCEEEKVLLYT